MQAETSASSPDGELVQWVNAYPQGFSLSTWVMPGLALALTLLYLANVLFEVRADSATVSFLLFSLMFTASMWMLALSASAAFAFANRPPNYVKRFSADRAAITAPPVSDPLIHMTVAIAFMSTCGLIYWFDDPFSSLPWDTGGFRESLVPYLGIVGALLSLALLAARPWRRRLILTPHALEYRRFGGPVTIPWDTIEELTPRTAAP